MAFAYPVASEEEVKIIIEQKRKEYHDARHVCYAYMLGFEKNVFRANDDGEPSGTAGRPILGQINSHNLSDVLVVVVRYFGGILLGTSGLITAYKTAANDALEVASKVEKIIEQTFQLRFGYERLNDVMRLVKELDLTIVSQDMQIDCTMTINVRKSQASIFSKRLSEMNPPVDFKGIN